MGLRAFFQAAVRYITRPVEFFYSATTTERTQHSKTALKNALIIALPLYVNMLSWQLAADLYDQHSDSADDHHAIHYLLWRNLIVAVAETVGGLSAQAIIELYSYLKLGNAPSSRSEYLTDCGINFITGATWQPIFDCGALMGKILNGNDNPNTATNMIFSSIFLGAGNCLAVSSAKFWYQQVNHVKKKTPPMITSMAADIIFGAAGPANFGSISPPGEKNLAGVALLALITVIPFEILRQFFTSFSEETEIFLPLITPDQAKDSSMPQDTELSHLQLRK